MDGLSRIQGRRFASFSRMGMTDMGDRGRSADALELTLFPEVRLKKTIEVRAADAQGMELAGALPALFTGILRR